MIYPENDRRSNRIHLIVMIVMFALIFLLGFTMEARGDEIFVIGHSWAGLFALSPPESIFNEQT